MFRLIFSLFIFCFSKYSYSDSTLYFGPSSKDDTGIIKNLNLTTHDKGVIRILSFNDTKQSAITGFKLESKTEISDDSIFWAMLSNENDEGYVKVSFKQTNNEDSCYLSKEPSEKIINVSGQNIKALSMCLNDANGVGHIVYMPLTKNGNDFMVKEFKRKNIVFVKVPTFRLAVPFDARGFTKRYKLLYGKPL